MNRRLFLAALGVFVSFDASVSSAQSIPDGLRPGESFHLAFVTEASREATFGEIEDYNRFVQAEAEKNPAVTGISAGVTYRAIVSALEETGTEVVAARDNVLVSAPVYTLTGQKVADGFADMWDGSLQHPINITQSLAQFEGVPFVWTGTETDGTPSPAWNIGAGDFTEPCGLTCVSFGGDSPLAGDHASTMGEWMVNLYAAPSNRLPFYALSNLIQVPGGLRGDFDSNGQLELADVNLLILKIAGNDNDVTFDVTDDNLVDSNDLATWVMELRGTWFGDANLDGEFNSTDLITVFQSNGYEQSVDVGWESGDWSADRRFDSSDLIAAFQDGGYELGPRQAVAAVPEPTGVVLIVLFIAIFTRRLRSTTPV